MKIAVMGTGGTGGYYGGLLAQKGHEVTFIARGAHLQAIQKNGLQIKSVHGDFKIAPARATDNPAGIGAVDLILFLTKTYDTESAVQSILPIVNKNTTMLSLQNGLDAAERIGQVIGMEHMLAGATWISSAVESPGVIKQASDFRRIAIGELDGRRSPRLQAVYEAFQETGITAELTENIQKVLWNKFIFISSASAFGSLTRLPMADYRSIPETRAQIRSLMNEVKSLAGASGVKLEDDAVEKALAIMDGSGPQIKASMQLDVESGHRTELESMIGVICHKGRQLGVPTPTADFIYAALLPVDLKARQK